MKHFTFHLRERFRRSFWVKESFCKENWRRDFLSCLSHVLSLAFWVANIQYDCWLGKPLRKFPCSSDMVNPFFVLSITFIHSFQSAFAISCLFTSNLQLFHCKCNSRKSQSDPRSWSPGNALWDPELPCRCTLRSRVAQHLPLARD